MIVGGVTSTQNRCAAWALW